ncbi:hypothetical protein KY343_02775 [Candidatus Woesearchaeota archaeon]|nr:hypothetical protein [Candidatus Woesearchaeota archaeon]
MIKDKNKKEKIETACLIILGMYIITLGTFFIHDPLDIKDFTGFVTTEIKDLIAEDSDNIQTDLTIVDETGTKIKAFDEEVGFYARYVNVNTNKIIENAICTIHFYDGSYTMQYNPLSQLYEYTRTFSSTGLYYWNVTCTKINFTSLTKRDITIIGSISGAYKETITDVCVEDWECTEWDTCLLNGVQYRECFDLNRCDELYDKKIILHIDRGIKPFHIQSCIYQPTCTDMIVNNNESDIDCGGHKCKKCEDGKICRNDNDCINKCDLITRRCHTPKIIPPEPVIEIPYMPRLKSSLVLIVAIIVLIITIISTYRYQAELFRRGVGYYKERREIAKIRREAKIDQKKRDRIRKFREKEAERRSKIARKAAKTRLKKLKEKRKLELEREKTRLKNLEKARERREELRKFREKEAERRSKIARKAAEERSAKLAKEKEIRLKNLEKARERREELIRLEEREKEIHKTRKEEYTRTLNDFLNKTVNKGYNEEQIEQLLINKGWPEKLVIKYCDKFFSKNKEIISEIRREERLSKGDPKELLKEIKKKEKIAKKHLQELENKLLEIDKKMRR